MDMGRTIANIYHGVCFYLVISICLVLLNEYI